MHIHLSDMKKIEKCTVKLIGLSFKFIHSNCTLYSYLKKIMDLKKINKGRLEPVSSLFSSIFFYST